MAAVDALTTAVRRSRVVEPERTQEERSARPWALKTETRTHPAPTKLKGYRATIGRLGHYGYATP